MDKVREFRTRATECRTSAAQAPTPELRNHYEELAIIWERLAEERLAYFIAQTKSGVAESVLRP